MVCTEAVLEKTGNHSPVEGTQRGHVWMCSEQCYQGTQKMQLDVKLGTRTVMIPLYIHAGYLETCLSRHVCLES